MKKIILFFLLISCTSLETDIDTNEKRLDFDKNLNFKEFNDLLIEYAEKKPYPNIDD
jgi:hypothetical protein